MSEDSERSFCPDTPNNNLRDLIVADGAQENYFENVYRVSEFNPINRDSFRASIEEPFYTGTGSHNRCNRDMVMAQKESVIDIGDYSVSFFQDLKDIKRILKIKQKHSPAPIIVEGDIVPDYGYSILTKNSKTRRIYRNDSHIDLWKYSDTDLVPFFKKIEVE